MNHKNTLITSQSTLNCQGKIIDLSTPQVMGIVNVNADSFYSESRVLTIEKALKRVEKILKEGAKIVDLGGMSSRPGAELISSKEECSRILPVLKALRNEFPKAFFSVDTLYAQTAERAIENGANIINDITAGKFDEMMIPTVAKLNCPFIAMHMRGTPKTMNECTNYEDLIVEMMDYFIERTAACKQAGIKDIVIDPGFGFAKTIHQNYHLLSNLQSLQIFGFPILTGISRKTMIWKALNISTEQALNGTTALHMVCLQQGAKILRVHDVKEAVETIKLFSILEKNKIRPDHSAI